MRLKKEQYLILLIVIGLFTFFMMRVENALKVESDQRQYRGADSKKLPGKPGNQH